MGQEVNLSIATRVIIALVSTVTLVLVVVGTFGYQAYSNHQWGLLKSELELDADRLSVGIALAAWNIDDRQIRRTIESTMQSPAVFGVYVNSGGTEYRLTRDDQWGVRQGAEEDFANAELLMAQRDIYFAEQNIGFLRLYLTSHFLEQKLAHTKRLIIGSIIMLDLVLIVSLYLLLWMSVLRPLKFIEQYALSVSSSRRNFPIPDSKPLVGEFDQLRNSLNRMVTLLESRMTELKDVNDRFWNMARGFPIPLTIYSPSDGQIVFVNNKFTELFGYQIEDMPTADIWFELAYPDPEYRREVIDTWDEKHGQVGRQGAQVESYTYNVTCKDGSVKYVEIGGVTAGAHTMGVFIDVTERNLAEKAVQAYQEHLELLVQQRTEELVAARDSAENANRAKSTFLANMSHELRTPLNSVIGFSQMMANEDEFNTIQKRNLEIINRSGHHLLTLINDILELSKIEAGKMEVTTEPVDLRSMLHEVAEMLRVRAEQAGISLIVEVGDLPVVVKADAAKLRQVLLNLLANAVKFTPRGGVTLWAKAQGTGDPMPIEFRVADTGVGIAPQDQDRVFEPFVQLDGVGQQSGTGLGLAISKQHVHMMGGELQLHSVPGQGTVFRFTLNLPVADQAPVNGSLDAGYSIEATEAFKGYRLLIVDDAEEIRLLLKDLLAPAGMTISEADNGARAKEKILTTHPHMVLLDWRMPGMDGVELTRQIRQRKDIDQPKIIMLTAHAFDESRKEALDAGVDDFMTKPVHVGQLYELIERHSGLRFKRNQPEPVSINGGRKSKLGRKDIADLSMEIRACFEEALRELSPSKISEALARLREEDPTLADQIQEYTDSMQYRHLWQVFDILPDSGDEK